MTRDELFEKMSGILQETFGIEASRIEPQARLREDLDIDSIDAVDLIGQLRPLIGGRLQPEVFKSVQTLQDVVDALYDLLKDAKAA